MVAWFSQIFGRNNDPIAHLRPGLGKLVRQAKTQALPKKHLGQYICEAALYRAIGLATGISQSRLSRLKKRTHNDR